MKENPKLQKNQNPKESPYWSFEFGVWDLFKASGWRQSLGKTGNGHIARFGETPAVKFDAFKLVQCLRRKITFAAVRTCYDRHVFDD
ncbi:MAG: hypothetical protein AAB217_01445, partial [Chloroflexota bacterium]